MNIRDDIPLSTGRVVKHSRMVNGGQQATPTPGDDTMTEPEWDEYCKIIRGRAAARGLIFIGPCND